MKALLGVPGRRPLRLPRDDRPAGHGPAGDRLVSRLSQRRLALDELVRWERWGAAAAVSLTRCHEARAAGGRWSPRRGRRRPRSSLQFDTAIRSRRSPRHVVAPHPARAVVLDRLLEPIGEIGVADPDEDLVEHDVVRRPGRRRCRRARPQIGVRARSSGRRARRRPTGPASGAQPTSRSRAPGATTPARSRRRRTRVPRPGP